MTRNIASIILVTIVISFMQDLKIEAKKQKSAAVISDINDFKDFKKLLRTKTNVLVLFLVEPKFSAEVLEVVKSSAELVKGQATLVVIDCTSSEPKKLCKKLKIGSEKPNYLKHYKDGEFNKDYDRSTTVSSMVNFLRDPTGDLPWDEDPDSADVTHLQDGEAVQKFLKRGPAVFKKALIMFYAPWCGYCKTLKPDYVLAAADLKGEAILAAIDVAKPGNSKVRQQYNITGFPTLLFYERGQLRFPYNGENKRAAIVDFMRDPLSQMRKKEKAEPAEESWPTDNTDVVHLTAETFDNALTGSEHALVVFYAPWCGHCKRIKPEYANAATALKQQGIAGVLGAVDATKEPELAERFGVKGYPTIKYFHKGEFKYDAGHARDQEALIKFMKNPSEPPPPPPAERPWAEEESHVRHLSTDTFKQSLRKIKHALVMFYAPWCGHCKSAKPEIVRAAEQFADELMVAFGAVDCTTEQALCSAQAVRGYPTIKYFSYFDKKTTDYSGGRKAEDFVSFINGQMAPLLSSKQQEAGFGTNVNIANDDDFSAYIGQRIPTFVFFYASWCANCESMKPAFSQLATQLSTEGSAQAVAIDIGIHNKTAQNVGIETVPSFILFRAASSVATYTGEKDKASMYAFVQKHLGKTEL